MLPYFLVRQSNWSANLLDYPHPFEEVPSPFTDREYVQEHSPNIHSCASISERIRVRPNRSGALAGRPSIGAPTALNRVPPLSPVSELSIYFII